MNLARNLALATPLRALAALLASGWCSTALAALGINHAFEPSTVVVGQPAKLTVNLINQNAAAATGTTVSVPLGGLSVADGGIQSGCGGTVSVVGGNLVLTGGTVPPGPGGTCSFSANVRSNAPGTYTSTIPVGSVSSSQGSNSERSSVALQVNALAPIVGSKAFSPTTLRGNGVATVTLTLVNSNAVAITGAALADSLPAALKVAPLPNAGGTCGGTVTAVPGASSATLAGGTIPAAGSCTVTFDVTPANASAYSAPASVANVIPAGGVTGDGGVKNAAPFRAAVAVYTGAQVVKRFETDPVVAGDSSILTLTIRNYNASPLTGVQFTDTLPNRVRDPKIEDNTCGGVADSTPGTVTLSGGTVDGSVGSVSQCVVRVRYTASNTNDDYRVATNDEASLGGKPSFDGVVADVDGDSVTINPRGMRVRVAKRFNGEQDLSGTAGTQSNTVRMEIALANDDTAPAAIQSFTDDLKLMGTGFRVNGTPATTCGGAVGVSADGTVITKSDGAIPAKGSCTISAPVQIGGDAAAGEWHRNRVGGNKPEYLNQLVTSQGRWGGLTWADLKVANALGVAKAFAPATFSSGQTTSNMTITLTRAAGATALAEVQLDDSFTAQGLPLKAEAVVSNTCGGTLDLATGVRLTGGTIALGAGGQDEASSCAIVVRVGAPDGTSGTWTNTIAAGAVTAANHVANPEAASTTVTATGAALGLSKEFAPTTLPGVGTTSVLTLVISNTQGAPAQTDLKLLDPLPPGMVVADVPNAALSGAGCVATPADIVATPGGSQFGIAGAGLSVKAGGTCRLSVTVLAKAAGNLTNRIARGALVSAAGLSNTGVAEATLTASGMSDVGVAITNNANGVTAGGSTTYVVSVTNNGPNDVAGAKLVNDVPAGATYGNWTCAAEGGAACPAASGTGALSQVVNVPVGGKLVYTIAATIAATATGPIVNTATVSVPGAVNDTNPDNNRASDSDPILATGPGPGPGPGPDPGPGPGPNATVAPVPATSPPALALLALLVMATGGWLGRRRAGRGGA